MGRLACWPHGIRLLQRDTASEWADPSQHTVPVLGAFEEAAAID